MDGIDLSIENLKEQLAEIKQKISLLRRKGIDMRIADLRLMSLPSKIKMAEITKDYKDVQKINSMLDSARDDIINLEKQNQKTDFS